MKFYPLSCLKYERPVWYSNYNQIYPTFASRVSNDDKIYMVRSILNEIRWRNIDIQFLNKKLEKMDNFFSIFAINCMINIKILQIEALRKQSKYLIIIKRNAFEACNGN